MHVCCPLPACRLLMLWRTYTAWAFCTGTSSRRTACWPSLQDTTPPSRSLSRYAPCQPYGLRQQPYCAVFVMACMALGGGSGALKQGQHFRMFGRVVADAHAHVDIIEAVLSRCGCVGRWRSDSSAQGLHDTHCSCLAEAAADTIVAVCIRCCCCCCHWLCLQIKLIDLGMAGLYRPNKPMHGCMGSPGFIAPEVILGEPHSVRSGRSQQLMVKK